MSSFKDYRMKDLWKNFLATGSIANSGIDATLRKIQDWGGTESAISHSTNNVKIQPAADSTTTFEVVDSSGGVLFTIDTVNKTVTAASGTKFSGDGSLLTSVVSTGVGGAQSDTTLTIQADATATQAAGDFTDGNDLVFKIGDVVVFRIPNTYAQDLPSGVEGNYILKNIADNWAEPSTGWIFDDVDDYAMIPHADTNGNLDFGTGHSSYEIYFKWLGSSTSSHMFLSKKAWINGTDYVGYALYSDNGTRVSINLYDGNNGGAFYVNYNFVENEIYHLVATEEFGNLYKLFINGDYIGSVDISTITNSLSNSEQFRLGTIGGLYCNAEIFLARVFNYLLSSDEIKALWNNGKPLEFIEPYKYQDASQTALTSGTLEIGKEYIIDTYVSGDDFTNVGASSNASGEVFVATGTTPTTWTNSSSLRAQGCVLEIKNMGKNGGIAKLGGKTIAFNTYGDPIAVNPNIDARSGVTGAAGTTTDTVLTDSVPRDKVLTRAIIYNNEASDRNINIGSTSGGTDVASDVTITASGYTLLDLKKYFSDNDETTLYISPGASNNGGAGTWVGTEDLDIRLYFE